ncbi:COBRA-like protein 6 [Linum grandiflorum]
MAAVGLVWVLVFIIIVSSSPSYGYDPLDPTANITIKWDLLVSSPGANSVQVTILNYQQYRHIEAPGWRVGWDWKGKEAISGMVGAEATQQGDCSRFKGQQPLPHCCDKHPVIVDLLPGAPYNTQFQNCCRGGVLTSMAQDTSNYLSSFQMTIIGGGGGGEGEGDDASSSPPDSGLKMPENFTLGLPGYTCGNASVVSPTKITHDGGRRWTQVLKTWKVVCSYSLFMASPSPKCCVSLSAFYDSTIVPCTHCSCGCQGANRGSKCAKVAEKVSVLQQKHDPTVEPPPFVRCTNHMCPVRIHWHVKENYKQYWRVKMTITNFNLIKNYSQWNMVILHPNLKNITQVFSFNYAPLDKFRYTNDSGMFWGINLYNDVLLEEGDTGNVQSEMLLAKEAGMFSLGEGWTFPRRILFNGDECVMPSPDNYPRLPNASPPLLPLSSSLLSFFFSIFLFFSFF